MTKKLIEPTPGEWTILNDSRHLGNGFNIIVLHSDQGDGFLAEICNYENNESHANAKMMAASKKMYNTLKNIKEWSAGKNQLPSLVIEDINKAIEAAELWVDDE